MSKYKKTFLLFVIIFGILATMGNVYAKDWGTDPESMGVSDVNVGDKAYLTSDYTHKKHNNFFCANYWQHFSGGHFEAVGKVSIIGNKSSGGNKEEHHSQGNGIIVYELGESNNKPGFYISPGVRNPAQVQLWRDLKSWVSSVGIKHYEGLKGFATSEDNPIGYSPIIYKKAKQYAESLDKEALKNNTKKSNIKVTTYKKDGKDYLKIGPFKYTFREKLTKIELSETNGNTIKPNIYGVYVGEKFNEVKLDQIKSGQNFYIILQADSKISIINKMKVYESHKVKAADIVFWKNQVNKAAIRFQNMIQFDISEKQEPVDTEWNPNIELFGNLKITKKDYDDSENISNVTFKINNANGQYVKRDSKGKITYVEEKNATLFKTNNKGEVKIKELRVGKYTITEIKNTNVAYGGNTGDVDSADIYYNTDANSNKKTVKDGKISINVKANANNYTNLFIYNKKKFIDISGKVWEDIAGGKDNTYATYGEDVYARGDILMENIKVSLKDKDGNIVKDSNGKEFTTKTDKNGEYKFRNVEISGLEEYNVEFEYDGLTYTSVKPLVGDEENNNSKAGEVVDQRKSLNSAFTNITNNGDNADRSHGRSRNSNGETTGTLTYENDTQKWTSTFKGTTYNTNLTANTNTTNYNINDLYKNGKYTTNNDDGSIEIQNINLGIRRREQPNLSIRNDLTSVKVQVNGYGTTYTKDSSGNLYKAREDFVTRNENDGTYNTNLTAKFGEEYGNYYREIYPSDIQFSSTLAKDDDAKKLKVYATYTITINNNSNSLSVEVPEIANYYNSNYSIIQDETVFATGDKLNGVELISVNGKETSKTLNHIEDKTVNDFKSSYITIGSITDAPKIEATKSLAINVTYQVNDETVLKVLSEGDQTLNTVSEINAYSTYYTQNIEGCKVGDVYAGIDRDSAPGNATPGKNETYEDDTDRAPSFILTAKGARQIEGTVFEDATSSELKSGEERKGDGKYEADKENTINGVKVELLTKDGNKATYYPEATSDDGQTPNRGVINLVGKTDSIITDNKGYYIFKGIEPDDGYLIKFTYGKQTENGIEYVTKICDKDGKAITDVNVQNYKSTIITSNKIREAFENGNKNWYKEDANKRYSDARDNYDVREKIDEELIELNENTTPTITSLEASTPQFVIPVEFDSIITDSNNNTFVHKISNVDFGIVERPRQSATLDKTIKHIKFADHNGTLLIDGDVDLKSNPKKLPKGIANVDGKLVITMDSEALYGSHIEIEYALTLSNTSELDYINESYYYYGDSKEKPVKFSAATLIDYVDSEMILKAGQETWKTYDLATNGLKLTDEQKETLLKQYNTIVSAEAIPANTKLSPIENGNPEEGKSQVTTSIVLEKLLDNNDTELTFENNGEVVKINKNGGSNIRTILGSYAPVLAENPDAEPENDQTDDTKAPTVQILPPTGSTNHNVMYAIIATVSLAVLGIGTYGVRKFLKK